MSVVVSIRGAFFVFPRVPSCYMLFHMLLSPAKMRENNIYFDKVGRDTHWRRCLIFWSLCLWPDGGLQHTQSHFVLAREVTAAHLASKHAPWKKGILYGEDRGIVPHWCMWSLVSWLQRLCGTTDKKRGTSRRFKLQNSQKCFCLKDKVHL